MSMKTTISHISFPHSHISYVYNISREESNPSRSYCTNYVNCYDYIRNVKPTNIIESRSSPPKSFPCGEIIVDLNITGQNIRGKVYGVLASERARVR